MLENYERRPVYPLRGNERRTSHGLSQRTEGPHESAASFKAKRVQKVQLRKLTSQGADHAKDAILCYISPLRISLMTLLSCVSEKAVSDKLESICGVCLDVRKPFLQPKEKASSIVDTSIFESILKSVTFGD